MHLDNGSFLEKLYARMPTLPRDLIHESLGHFGNPMALQTLSQSSRTTILDARHHHHGYSRRTKTIIIQYNENTLSSRLQQ